MLLYHGSCRPGLGVIEPREESRPHGQDRPLVWATSDPRRAAVFALQPWKTSQRILGFRDTDKLRVEYDTTRFSLDTPGTIYILDALERLPTPTDSVQGWGCRPQEYLRGRPYYHSERARPVIGRIELANVGRFLAEHGVEIKERVGLLPRRGA